MPAEQSQSQKGKFKNQKLRNILFTRRKIVIYVFIIFTLALLTKPSDETCKKQAAASVKSRVLNKYGATDENDLMNRMIDMTAMNGITVKDNLLFKKIYFRFGNSENSIGWAAFGMVHINQNK
jgi:hypothetical protein